MRGGRKETRDGRKETRGGRKETRGGRKEKDTPCPPPHFQQFSRSRIVS